VAREEKKRILACTLAHKGISSSSSSYEIGIFDIEEKAIADLLHAKAEVYIKAYSRQGLSIGSDVLQDLSWTQAELVGVRKGCIIHEHQLRAMRTRRQGTPTMVGQLGKEASIAAKEIQAKIKLYNLTPRETQHMSITNTFNVQGSYNRLYQDSTDNSVNIVNDAEIFQSLQTLISANIADETERKELLQHLQELQQEKSKSGYMQKITALLTASSKIAPLLADYLPALIDWAKHLA